jgi:hypothetical protein
MGGLTVAGFGVLGVIGIMLVGFGALRRDHESLLAGATLLAALAGLWLFGLVGLGVGAGVFALLWWKRPRG